MQVGDLAVIDISATTIDEDGSTGQVIPDAESKGLTVILTEEMSLTPSKSSFPFASDVEMCCYVYRISF